MGKHSVVVYIIRDEHHQDRRMRLRSLFSSDIFRVIVPNIPFTDEDSTKEKREAYQVGWCLSDAKESFPKNPVIVVKDSSLCVADSETVSGVISSCLSVGDFHICYLCKWSDKCHLYSHRKEVSHTKNSIAKTQSPHGVQALLFTPEGRDLVLGIKPMKDGEFFRARGSLSKSLNHHIVRGHINAFCVVPNLVAFDISLATDDEDFLKVNECEPVNYPIVDGGNGVNVYIAIIIIVILFIVLVWAAIAASPRLA
jgi:hypothetical protein